MDPQRQIIEEILVLTDGADIPIWFFGSYALQALEGRPIRGHADVDLFARVEDQEPLRSVMASAGFERTNADSYRTKYAKGGVGVDCCTFRRLVDRTLVTDAGDERLWPWPDNSLPDEPNGVLFGMPVRALSSEGQYLFKASFQVYHLSSSFAHFRSLTPEPLSHGQRGCSSLPPPGEGWPTAPSVRRDEGDLFVH